MKKRLLSLVLCLVMVFALFPTFAAPAQAAGPGITDPAPTADPIGKLNLTKTLTPGANGAYDVNMESWSTGEVHAYTEKIPTDFVVVVDQSGSMDTRDMPTGTPSVQNNKYLEDIAADAYYYKDGDNYYRVYGVRDYLYRYYPANYWFTGDIVEHLGTDIGWFMGETNATTNIDNAFYFREVVNGTTYYIPIQTTIQGKIGTYVMRFQFPSKMTGNTYKFDREVTTYSSNGNSPWYKNVLNGDVMTSGALWSTANGTVQTLYPNDNEYTFSTINLLLARPRTGMYINYPMYGRHLSYTKLCYRDVNGVEHTLPSNQSGQTVWEYCDDDGIARTTDSVTSARPTYSGLYTFPTQTDRITALKAALNEFAQAVANETDSFGPVDNRVSIVGFSSSGYNNTELLTHTERNITGTSTNGWQKNTCDGNVSEYYGKGLVGATDGNAGTVNAKISRAITAITANGGTQPEDGLDMAYKVLTNRGTGEGKDTYTIRSGAQKGQSVDRNTVVIFFTDGQPGDYHYSDQYSEANEVVAQAKLIKDYGKTLDYGTSIFSIGVFGESDANPLTYADTSQSQSNRQAWKYLGGWMETYQSGGTYYCLRRQWRPNNADGYTATPNDTIFDYMSVVSSNYPDAEHFIAQAWLNGNYSGNYIAATDGDTMRHKSTSESTNKYYRMASSQDTLVAAFLAAVTMNNEETGTPVTINSTAVFRDQVNLDDFDVTGATVSAKVVDMNGNVDNTLTGQLTTDSSNLAANGTVTVTGFDYSRNYVVNGQGNKLVVTISGLTPKKASGTLYSNKDVKDEDNNDVFGAGLYGSGMDRPVVQIASPTLVIPGGGEKTYIIDFNAEMKVATGAKKLGKTTGTNGVFTPGSGSTFDVFYKLGGGLDGKNFTASYSGVDTAMIYGVPVNSAAGTTAAWNKITTVPANNIYFDDDLGQLTATENGSGYNSQIRVLKEETVADGPFTFTFKGSRIDIYCTTEGTSGGVTATLKQGDTVITNNIISNKYQGGGALYNVPTVVFEGLDPASEYTVTIRTNGSSNYKLDGVRVYNAAAETGDVAKAYSDADEANSIFLKVRDQLLPNSMISTLNQYLDDLAAYNALEDKDGVEPPTEPQNIPGVAFYKDVAYEEGANKYAKLSDYVKTGPKNEVYLTNGEVVSFAIKNCPDDMQVWIGLSALDGKTGSIEVNDEAYTPDIASTVDMYYKVTPKEIEGEQTLKIKNVGSSMISVTNVKITGSNATNPSLNASVLSVADAESAASVLSVEDGLPYLAVTPRLLNSLNAPAQAEDPEPTPTADPEPTPTADPEPTPTQQPSFAEWISNLLSSFVNALFGSIARLFGH